MPLTKSTNYVASLKILKTEVQRKLGRSKNSVLTELDILGTLLEDPSELHNMLSSDSLRQILVAGLLGLYTNHPTAALKLASAFLHSAFQKYISPYAHRSASDTIEQVRDWIQATDLLLQGILAYLDREDNDQEALGIGFFPTGCTVLIAAIKTNLPAPWIKHLCNILTDAAGGCKANIGILRQKTWLGATRIGELISTTKEYLVLEALLELLPNVLPSSLDAKLRHRFLDDLEKGLPKRMSTHADIRGLLANVSMESSWEKISDNIVKCLAQADINFPQPIPLVSITADGGSLIHCEQIYVDCDSFIVNIPEKDGEIDTLQIFFRTIRHIDFRTSLPAQTCNVTLNLTTPPLLAGWEMKLKSSPFKVELVFGENFLPLFRSVLCTRNVAHLLGTRGINKPRLALSESVSCEKPNPKIESQKESFVQAEKVDALDHTVESKENRINYAPFGPTGFADEQFGTFSKEEIERVSVVDNRDKVSPGSSSFNAGEIGIGASNPVLETVSENRCKKIENTHVADFIAIKRKRQASPSPSSRSRKRTRCDSEEQSPSSQDQDASVKDEGPKPKPTSTYGARKKERENVNGPIMHDVSLSKEEVEDPKSGKDRETSSTTADLKGILKPSLRMNMKPRLKRPHSRVLRSGVSDNQQAIDNKEMKDTQRKKKQVKLPSEDDLLEKSGEVELIHIDDITVPTLPSPGRRSQLPFCCDLESTGLRTGPRATVPEGSQEPTDRDSPTMFESKVFPIDIREEKTIEVQNSFKEEIRNVSKRISDLHTAILENGESTFTSLYSPLKLNATKTAHYTSKTDPTEILVPKGVPTIDLTKDDSENEHPDAVRPKANINTSTMKSKYSRPTLVMRATVDTLDELSHLVSPPPGYSSIPPYSSVSRLSRIPPLKPLQNQADEHEGHRPIEYSPIDLRSVRSTDYARTSQVSDKVHKSYHVEEKASLLDILEVFNNITEIIIENINSKSQSLKLEARIARDRILIDASTELDSIRKGSANCYNQLLELKGASDKNGSEVRKSWEELRISNDKLNVRLHDLAKQSGSKSIRRVPEQLSTHFLPDSFRL